MESKRGRKQYTCLERPAPSEVASRTCGVVGQPCFQMAIAWSAGSSRSGYSPGVPPQPHRGASEQTREDLTKYRRCHSLMWRSRHPQLPSANMATTTLLVSVVEDLVSHANWPGRPTCCTGSEHSPPANCVARLIRHVSACQLRSQNLMAPMLVMICASMAHCPWTIRDGSHMEEDGL